MPTMPIAVGETWETSPTTGTMVESPLGMLTWLVPIIERTGAQPSNGDDANRGRGGVGDIADDEDNSGKRS
jgi:hypothetical protein